MLATEWPLTRAPFTESDIENESITSPIFERLQELKKKVPDVKQKNYKIWKKYVFTPVPSINFEVISRAYHKIDEIDKTCILPNFHSSLHICEAPGGFVQFACNNHPELRNWCATSLQDNIEFKKDLLDMSKGCILDLEENGNILFKKVRDSIKEKGKFDLVTADGAEEKHDNIEKHNYELLLAQTDIALSCLEENGTFVCKYFEGCDIKTQIWIGVLTNCFKNVSLIKPNTSRATNSERYLVAKGFIKELDIYKNYFVENTWLNDLGEIITKHSETQIKSMENVFSKITL